MTQKRLIHKVSQFTENGDEGVFLLGLNKEGNVEAATVTHGSLDVHNACIHDVLINRHFINFDSATENPSSPITAGDVTVLVASTTGFSIGNVVIIKDNGGNIREYHLRITAIVTNTSITFNRPVDHDYTTAATIERVLINMNVAGTLSSPIIYKVSPPSGVVWHISRVLISITSTTPMDDALFGGITALTNGVVLRDVRAAGLNTLSCWRTNGNMIEDMYDVTYADKAPAGSYGLRGRFTFKRVDVSINLNGNESDELQILIQDNLTGLSSFIVKAQGHIEG